MKNRILALAFAGATAVATSASAVTYDLSWVGSSGFSMTGSFSFDDALIGTGAIDETDIDTLTLSVFQNGLLQATSELGVDYASLNNFNFNTTTEEFVVGGCTSSTGGQLWNHTGLGGGAGFQSGCGAQGVAISSTSTWNGSIPIGSSTLTASLAAPAIDPVPLPAGGVLMATGVVGLAAMRRRKAAKA